MRIAIIILLSLFILFSCSDTKHDSTSQNVKFELVPEPDKTEQPGYEALQRLQISDCMFSNPDTSVLSLKLRDVQSGKTFIGNDRPGSYDEYRYYSKNFQQLLSLTQHPGDGNYQISIFRVEYAKKDDYGYRKLNVDTIKTEKGIMPGMSKAEIISRLGTCYASLDSTKGYMELYYKIESPKTAKHIFFPVTICQFIMHPINSEMVDWKRLNLDLNTLENIIARTANTGLPIYRLINKCWTKQNNGTFVIQIS